MCGNQEKFQLWQFSVIGISNSGIYCNIYAIVIFLSGINLEVYLMYFCKILVILYDSFQSKEMQKVKHVSQ